MVGAVAGQEKGEVLSQFMILLHNVRDLIRQMPDRLDAWARRTAALPHQPIDPWGDESPRPADVPDMVCRHCLLEWPCAEYGRLTEGHRLWPDRGLARDHRRSRWTPPEAAGPAIAVFWLPNAPVDLEAPTVAELAGGVDLTPYLAGLPATVPPESHVCRWVMVRAGASADDDLYRCGLHWSDGTRCDSRTVDPTVVHRRQWLVERHNGGGS